MPKNIKIKKLRERKILELGITTKNAIKDNTLELLKPGEKLGATNDTMWKTMFNNENRKKYACKLLSCILNVSYDELFNNLHYGKEILDKEKYYSKGEMVDFVAIIDGVAVEIEVNCTERTERNIDYATRLYHRHVKIGNKSYEFTKTIQISLNNYSFKGREDITEEEFTLRNVKGEWLTDKLQFIYFYIPAIRKVWYNGNRNKLTAAEKCILAYVEKDISEAKKIARGDKIVEDYIEESQAVIEEDDFQEAYDHDKLNYEYGLLIGEERGKEAGIQIGEERGRLDEKQEIAKNLLQVKPEIPLEVIAQTTGLSLEDLKELKSSK